MTLQLICLSGLQKHRNNEKQFFSGLVRANCGEGSICTAQAALNPSDLTVQEALSSLCAKPWAARLWLPPWRNTGPGGSSPLGREGLQEAAWVCNARWMSHLQALGLAAMGNSEGCKTPPKSPGREGQGSTCSPQYQPSNT